MTADAELFAKLLAYYNVQPDRRGWAHVACPRCGKTGKHFGFSLTRGVKCLVCGYSANLYQLARSLELPDEAPVYVPPPPKPKPGWLANALDFVDAAAGHADQWRKYKPLPGDVVRDYRLGYGPFPAQTSQCAHARLLVPIIVAGEVIGLRGRSTGCGCKKWLSASGSQIALYNGAQLVRSHERARSLRLAYSRNPFALGQVVWIMENPVDALLFEARYPLLRAVAILGAANWYDEWTAAILECKPAAVIVALDHDLAGNGAANAAEHERMLAAWRAGIIERGGRVPPVAPSPNGVKIANALAEAGAPVSLFHWKESDPIKADIGGLLEKK